MSVSGERSPDEQPDTPAEEPRMTEVIVSTSGGAVSGLARDGSTVFYSIPYAEAPVGELAFAPPRAHGGWPGVRDARTPGATAQVTGFDNGTIPEPSVPGDEVLTVNVFTPRTPVAGDTPMPVFVWIHGGAFIAGSPHSPWYDGVAFNRAGIVVVSVGYRVGLTGFGDVAGAVPNRAVLDWIAALQWVQRNIAAFGGDPERVTIGGQSAGAAAVLTLMGLQAASGLFHRVIAASPVLLQQRPATARPIADEAASLLGTVATADALSRKSRVELADVVWRMKDVFGNAPARADAETDLVSLLDEILASVQFASLIDGDVLPVSIVEGVCRRTAHIPLLIGATADEFNSLVRGIGRVGESDRGAMERLGYSSEIAAEYVAARHGLSGHALMAQALSDLMVRTHLAAVAECHDPTWVYDFAWKANGVFSPGDAFHCLDLPFGWGLLDAESARLRTGPVPDGLVDALHDAWVAFIKGDGPGWPSYAHDRTVRRYDATVADVCDGYRAERILLRDGYPGR